MKNVTESIFIVGMPRSGSTLVESIISMKENIYDLGENNLFAISICFGCITILPSNPIL